MGGVAFRRSATWMQQLDDRILEYIEEEGWSTPKIMSQESEFRDASRARLEERCRGLVYAGLLAPISGDMVELTTWGRLYLDGELDADHQPRPTKRVLQA